MRVREQERRVSTVAVSGNPRGQSPSRRQQDPIPVAGLPSGAQLGAVDRAEQAEEALRRIVCVLESGGLDALDEHRLAAIAIACDVLDIEPL